MDAGDAAVFFCGGEYVVYRCQDCRRRRLEGGGVAKGAGEVGGADVDAVKAGGGDDVVDGGEAFAGFDHGEGDDFVVGAAVVVVAVADEGANRAVAATADGWVADAGGKTVGGGAGC